MSKKRAKIRRHPNMQRRSRGRLFEADPPCPDCGAPDPSPVAGEWFGGCGCLYTTWQCEGCGYEWMTRETS